MSTVMWENALQGVTPRTGGSALPPGTYRLRPIGGEGKLNSNSNIMMSLQFEVVSGPLQGRKAFHNENLPKGNSDQDKERMGYFLGLMEAFGITGQQLGQMFAGQPISVETIDYLAKQLVQMGRIVKGTCRKQNNDDTRVNWGGWLVDDGSEPAPPASLNKPAVPSGPPAPGMGSNLPLGGFPGSNQPGTMQPNAGPAWAQQPAAQAPQGFAPAAAQAPQQGFQQQALQEGFQGQQFPGQVNPAAFQQPAAAQAQGMQQFGTTQQDQVAPAFGGPVQGFQGQPNQQGQFPQQAQPALGGPQGQAPAPGFGQPGQQMPGMPQPQQPQGGPAGLPQGGFPPQGGAPTASF